MSVRKRRHHVAQAEVCRQAQVKHYHVRRERESVLLNKGLVIWDHCFFIGAQARFECPDRPLGPTPAPGRQCPSSWYLPKFKDGQGRIIG